MNELHHDDVIYIPRISIQAFCETNEFSSLVQGITSDRRMEKVQMRLQMGGIDAAIEAYSSSPTPNMIFIESENRRGDLIAKLNELSQYCDEGTKVMVFGRTNDIQLYRTLIDMGISDYVMLPMSPVDIIKIIGKTYQANKSTKPLGRVLAVIGAKGGVGASTIAHNIGFTFSRELARSTCLVDLNFAFGTMGLNFNQDPVQGAADALSSPDRIDAALIDRLMTKYSDSLSLLAAPAVLEKTYDFSGDAVESLIEGLRNSCPSIILDVPNQWNSGIKKALMQADDILIVAEPDLANLRNLKNLFEVLKQLRPHDKAPHYVLNNMGLAKRPEIRATDFARAVEDEPLAIFPHDPALFGAAANNGQMLAELDPVNPIVMGFVQLAQLIGKQKEIQTMKAKPGLFAQFGSLGETWAKLSKKA